jgi:hypothetical protein
MSAQGLQHVVCRGAIDRSFFSELATSPQFALAGFDLTAEERNLILALAPRDLIELAHGIEAWRKGSLPVTSAPARELVHGGHSH